MKKESRHAEESLGLLGPVSSYPEESEPPAAVAFVDKSFRPSNQFMRMCPI